MQQIFQLAYFSFIAAIMIFDRFPKFGRANEMHGAVLLEMVKSRMNETYLPHVIDEVQSKSKGPNTLIKALL